MKRAAFGLVGAVLVLVGAGIGFVVARSGKLAHTVTQTVIQNPRTSTPSWTGTWNTTYGTMTLVQAGHTVTGYYTTGNRGNSRIRGTLSGHVLTGTWDQAPSHKPPKDAGDIQFTIDNDGTRFTGRWRNDSTGKWHADWNGKQ